MGSWTPWSHFSSQSSRSSTVTTAKLYSIQGVNILIAYLAELPNNTRYSNSLQLALTSNLLLDVGLDV